jgi:hypothetical protein
MGGEGDWSRCRLLLSTNSKSALYSTTFAGVPFSPSLSPLPRLLDQKIEFVFNCIVVEVVGKGQNKREREGVQREGELTSTVGRGRDVPGLKLSQG